MIVGPMFAGKTTTLLRRIQAETQKGRFVASLLFYSCFIQWVCLTVLLVAFVLSVGSCLSIGTVVGMHQFYS